MTLSDPARVVVEETQRLLDEANGIVHEDLSTRLRNIALTEGAGTSEHTQAADTGQGVNVRHRERSGGRSEQVTYLGFLADSDIVV